MVADSDGVRWLCQQQDGDEAYRELPPEIRPRPRRRGSDVPASRKRMMQVRPQTCSTGFMLRTA
jgi:hypothetical protein